LQQIYRELAANLLRVCSIFIASLLRIWREIAGYLPRFYCTFATWLLQICSKVAAILPQFCHEFAVNLPRVGAHLPQCCWDFAMSLLDFYHNFAATLLHDSCELSTYLQLFCRVFAANLPRVCCKFTGSLSRDLLRKSFCRTSRKSRGKLVVNDILLYRDICREFTASLPQPGNILPRHCRVFAVSI
jgi:hypothetical protein